MVSRIKHTEKPEVNFLNSLLIKYKLASYLWYSVIIITMSFADKDPNFTLPANFYTDTDIFNEELQKIFYSKWVYVALSLIHIFTLFPFIYSTPVARLPEKSIFVVRALHLISRFFLLPNIGSR